MVLVDTSVAYTGLNPDLLQVLFHGMILICTINKNRGTVHVSVVYVAHTCAQDFQ